MPRDGNGQYVLPPSNPVISGTVIESDWANDTMADLANAITQSLSYDGQTVPIADLPMGGFRHINVGAPTSRTQYATLGMVQDGNHQRVQVVSGVDNIVGTLVGGATAYTPGAIISLFAPATNTGPMTLNYNGIGARSLVDANSVPLAPGDVQAGDFLTAIYTGTEFRLITAIDSTQAADLYNLSITGQVRPPSNAYLQLSIASATSINIPAGSAWIVPPGNNADNSELVTWNSQSVTLQFLNSSFTTFIVVDSTGAIQQIPGRAIGANFRNFAILGVVEHITGVANQVITRPSIFGDDGYRARDQTSLLANTIINGGLVTPNGVSGLQLDVFQGTIFIPGGNANTPDAPNTFNIPPQQNIQFRTLAGTNTVSAVTQTVPVGSYDANGAGIIAALPNPGDATVHRLYYLYGQYILVYGQQVYSSVENASSLIEYDRTKYKKSLYLADATLMAEIIAIRTATNLNLLAQGAVICPGGLNFSIGSPGGIAEAPIDGFPYGRKNAAWSKVLEAISPTITTDATISGAAPVLKETITPINSAGTSGWAVFNSANKWYGEETVLPDDNLYMRSYNPGTGALRFTTTYDLATGKWDFPVGPSIGTMPLRGALENVLALSVTATLTTAHANRLMYCTQAAAITLTLPLANTYPPGNRISFLGVGAGQVTLARQGADVIRQPGSTQTSITFNQGDAIDLVSDGASLWIVNSGYAQQSIYSNAAGRLLKVGSFGLGADTMAFDGLGFTDLNQYIVTGNYYINTASTVTNLPAGAANGILVVNGATTNFTVQTYTYWTGTNAGLRYTRVRNNGTWTAWRRLQAVGEFGIGAVGNINITDANALLTGGLYSVGNTWTGSPFASGDSRNFGTLQVNMWADSTAATQIFMSVNADLMYWRRRSGSAWGGWIEVFNGSTAPASLTFQNSFFDVNTLRYVRHGKMVTISGILGHAGAWPQSGAVIANIPAGFRPSAPSGMTTTVTYANLARCAACLIMNTNGDFYVDSFVNILAAPDSGTGQAPVCITFPGV